MAEGLLSRRGGGLDVNGVIDSGFSGTSAVIDKGELLVGRTNGVSPGTIKYSRVNSTSASCWSNDYKTNVVCRTSEPDVVIGFWFNPTSSASGALIAKIAQLSLSGDVTALGGATTHSFSTITGISLGRGIAVVEMGADEYVAIYNEAASPYAIKAAFIRYNKGSSTPFSTPVITELGLDGGSYRYIVMAEKIQGNAFLLHTRVIGSTSTNTLTACDVAAGGTITKGTPTVVTLTGSSEYFYCPSLSSLGDDLYALAYTVEDSGYVGYPGRPTATPLKIQNKVITQGTRVRLNTESAHGARGPGKYEQLMPGVGMFCHTRKTYTSGSDEYSLVAVTFKVSSSLVLTVIGQGNNVVGGGNRPIFVYKYSDRIGVALYGDNSTGYYIRHAYITLNATGEVSDVTNNLAVTSSPAGNAWEVCAAKLFGTMFAYILSSEATTQTYRRETVYLASAGPFGPTVWTKGSEAAIHNGVHKIGVAKTKALGVGEPVEVIASS